MLNRIKVVTSLLLVLGLFGLLQITSSGVFFDALKSDKESITVLQTIRQQQAALNNSWVALIQTRNTLNRAGIRYMADQNNSGSGATLPDLLQLAQSQLKQAESEWAHYHNLPRVTDQSDDAAQQVDQRYDTLHNALTELIQLLSAGNIKAFFDQPTQRYQDSFEQAYNSYLLENDRLYQRAVAANSAAYDLSLWLLFGVLFCVAIAIAAVWLGIQRVLIRPLHSLMANIRQFAVGDLSGQISVHGSNEMGQLADSLRHMQSELIRTVSDVRQGSSAIYSGASEISAGNNDLSSRTEQQAASLEETAASMEQLTATVKQNADNARQASQLAQEASRTAGEGGEIVGQVVRTMHDITHSSQKNWRYYRRDRCHCLPD